jgi:DNA-directed RNA polymerase subunit RPC12/RpoP
VEWEVKDTVVCVDCGREARGYRIIRARAYDRTRDSHPEYRCEECSIRKTQELRQRGIPFRSNSQPYSLSFRFLLQSEVLPAIVASRGSPCEPDTVVLR